MNESTCTKMNAKNEGNSKGEDDENKRQDKIHEMWIQKFHMDVNYILYKLITHANMTIKRLYFSPTQVQQGKQCTRVTSCKPVWSGSQNWGENCLSLWASSHPTDCWVSPLVIPGLKSTPWELPIWDNTLLLKNQKYLWETVENNWMFFCLWEPGEIKEIKILIPSEVVRKPFFFVWEKLSWFFRTNCMRKKSKQMGKNKLLNTS